MTQIYLQYTQAAAVSLIGFILTFFGISCVSPNLQAQDINYGIKIGSNISQFHSQQTNMNTNQWAARPAVGLYLQAHSDFSNTFFQSELLFSQKSGIIRDNQPVKSKFLIDISNTATKIHRSIHYLSIPFIVGTKTPDEKVATYIGAMISYPIYAQQRSDRNNNHWYTTEVLNSVIMGQFGLQLKLRKMVRLDIRYEYSLWGVGMALSDKHQANDRIHNIQVAILWDLYSELDNIFRFQK